MSRKKAGPSNPPKRRATSTLSFISKSQLSSARLRLKLRIVAIPKTQLQARTKGTKINRSPYLARRAPSTNSSANLPKMICQGWVCTASTIKCLTTSCSTLRKKPNFNLKIRSILLTRSRRKKAKKCLVTTSY